MRYLDLFERAPDASVFGRAKAAFAALSFPARSAIEAWETMNWTGGVLEQHILANDEVAQEIEAAFLPVRAALPDRITLYRGIQIDSAHDSWKNAYLTSWSSDRRVAELFAGLRRGKRWTSMLMPEVTDEEIATMAASYERTGFLRFGGRYYVRNRQNPRYYNIYDRSKQFVTDGDDIAEDLYNEQKHRREYNEDRLAKAHIFEEEISRDRVVWISNSLNCKEYLVRPVA